MIIPHELPTDEVLERIKSQLDEVKNEYGNDVNVSNMRYEWDGNSGKLSLWAMGFYVSGTLTVNQNQIELSGTFPITAYFFKKQIEPIIREQVEAALA